MLYRLLLKFWLLPPMLNIVGIAAGLLIMLRYKKLGVAICLLSVSSLWLLSTPYVANGLLLCLEESGSVPPAKIAQLDNAAIVVLGSGNVNYAPEYRSVQPDPQAIARLNYAAFVHRLSDLPVMLTGGRGFGNGVPHAFVLDEFMRSQLGVNARWLESQSRTTWENALFAAEILFDEGIDNVVIVTQSYHMRRSLKLFKAAGFKVFAAPTQLANPEMEVGVIEFWLPNTGALDLSRAVMHEYLGLAWYKLFPPPPPGQRPL